MFSNEINIKFVTNFKKFRNTGSLDETEWKLFSVKGNNLKKKTSAPQTTTPTYV